MSTLPWRHIAIEGPIGVGKTSLTNLLAKRFRGTEAHVGRSGFMKGNLE